MFIEMFKKQLQSRHDQSGKVPISIFFILILAALFLCFGLRFFADVLLKSFSTLAGAEILKYLS